MESPHETFRNIWAKQPLQKTRCRILLVDTDDLTLQKNRFNLKRSGYRDVAAYTSISACQKQIDDHYCDMVYLDIASDHAQDQGFELLMWLRARDFRGTIVVLASQPTIPLLYRAAMLGAKEVLIKTPMLDLSKETKRILEQRCKNDCAKWHSDAFMNSGVFGTMGLSEGELSVLREFANGFPRHLEIAERLGKSNPHIRKTFSRIYEKISGYIPVENSAQLSHLITICSLFH